MLAESADMDLDLTVMQVLFENVTGQATEVLNLMSAPQMASMHTPERLPLLSQGPEALGW